MGIEIERKFLVADDGWREQVASTQRLRQAYLGGDRVSLRVRTAGDAAWLNIKSREFGVRRQEFEYAIAPADAEALFALAGEAIDKRRHLVDHAGHRWEVDEFLGDNAGLVVAEIELASEDEAFERPPWLGAEVTDDPRYYNTWLAAHPFRTWDGDARDDDVKD